MTEGQGTKNIPGSLSVLSGIKGFQSGIVLSGDTTLERDHFGQILVYAGTTDITVTIPDSVTLDAPSFGGFALQAFSSGMIRLAGAAGVEVGFGTYRVNEIVHIRRIFENYYANENLTSIDEPVTILVRTTGGANPINPLRENNAFQFPSQAMDFLRSYKLNASVTVDIGAGTFSETDMNFSHPDGNMITVKGVGPITYTVAGLTNPGGAGRVAQNNVTLGSLGGDFSTIIRPSTSMDMTDCPISFEDIFFHSDGVGQFLVSAQWADNLTVFTRCAFSDFSSLAALTYVGLFFDSCVFNGFTSNALRYKQYLRLRSQWLIFTLPNCRNEPEPSVSNYC